MKHHLFVFGLFALYLTVMTSIMVWQGIGIAPDRYALVLLLGSLVIKKTRAFLLDWVPFLLLLISYDFLRGLAPMLSQNVNYYPLVNADLFLFHQLPSQSLQQAFFNPQQIRWYDYLATVFDFLHFALPLGFGYLVWIKDRKFFRQFVAGILILSYAAWATFVLFPAAPPWLASEKGYISGVTKVMSYTMDIFPDRASLPTIYHQLNPNLTAAMPSLHAAYPFLILLFAFYFFGKKAAPFSIYVLGVWLSIVYLGEHYVIDIIVGAVYAFWAFFITIKLWRFKTLFKNYKKAV